MKNRQHEIQKYLQTVDKAGLKDIYMNVSFTYYANWGKHLGNLLSKMVRKGLVERVKPGVFKHLRMDAYKEDNDPNQKLMFD